MVPKSPHRIPPTSLADLPPELGSKLAQYFGEKEVAAMRCVSAYWNTICQTEMRRRKPLTFDIEDLDKLLQFSDTFIKYTPAEDIAAGRFCFNLRALDTAAAEEPLTNFAQRFGSLVTTLALDLYDPDWPEEGQNWFDAPPHRETVVGHVTLLLEGVKGQVEVLELTGYTGLDSRVVGSEAFPRLRTLILGCSPTHRASLLTVNLQEAFIMLLSRRVPALRKFEARHFATVHGDPCFLPYLLRNLVRVNGAVEVKLDMTVDFEENGDRALMTAAVRIVELKFRESTPAIESSDRLEWFRRMLRWVGAQSDCLKKLILRTCADNEAILAGLKLPNMRALEHLDYLQSTVESLLRIDSPDDFPNLRTVRTVSTGNDYTVALPQVTELTLERSWLTGIAAWNLGYCGQALFQLPPFPNVETLTLSVKFIDLVTLVQLRNLRHLTVTFDELSRNARSFWKRVTNGARKLTLEQIQALPATVENAVRRVTKANFSDLRHLKQITVVLRDNTLSAKLDAILYLSKTKLLQKLEKFEIQLYLDDEDEEITQVYLEELRKYHSAVIVCQHEFRITDF